MKTNKIELLLSMSKSEFNRFIKYCIIGAVCASIDFIIFSLLTLKFSWNWLPANCFSVTVGIFSSFILNATLNFKPTNRYFSRFLMFFSTGIAGLILGSLLIYLLHGLFEFKEWIAKLISIVFVTAFQYLVNRNVTFRNTKSAKVKNTHT